MIIDRLEAPISQLLIETDVLVDYLVAPTRGSSLLRDALRHHRCYTTMLNALELFTGARTPNERAAVRAVLMLVRVLGYPARVAESAASALEHTSDHALTTREMVVLSLARSSKLSVLTRRYYQRYRELSIVPVVDSISTEPSTLAPSLLITPAQGIA